MGYIMAKIKLSGRKFKKIISEELNVLMEQEKMNPAALRQSIDEIIEQLNDHSLVLQKVLYAKSMRGDKDTTEKLTQVIKAHNNYIQSLEQIKGDL